MLDIGISVAIGLVTLITAYMGAHVTLHPAESAEARILYKLMFAACGAVACVLIGWQTYRNNEAQTNLKEQLAQIERNTKEPPRVQVNVPPAQVVINPPENASPTELGRRAVLLERLREEYILSHDDISAALMAGTEQPPAYWVNMKLRGRGEKWSVTQTNMIGESPCSNPLISFNQETFRPLETEPGLMYGIRATLQLKIGEKVWQPKRLRVWADNYIDKVDGEHVAPTWQNINRRKYHDYVLEDRPQADKMQIQFVASDPIKIVCIDMINLTAEQAKDLHLP
jgi:hypothetical protein